MPDSSTPGAARKALAVLAAGGLLTAGIAAASPAVAVQRTADTGTAQEGSGTTDSPSDTPAPADGPIKADGEEGDKLGDADREKLAEAEASGEPTTTIIVVTKDGASADVAQSIRAAGGYVRYESAKLGYLSAVVRTAQVLKTADLAKVLSVDLDETLKQPEPVARASSGVDYDGPDAGTPNSNPYMPTKDTGSIAFKRAHPTWDGRGVTVGILDSGVDLDHPALARTSTGEKKITDWFTATDPVTEGEFVAGGDPTWLAMVQDATGPTFPATGIYRGSSWTLPATGAFKIKTVDEARTELEGCEVCGDLNRDGDTTDRIGVLYDPVSHAVWVDSDDDKSFTDEMAMQPYRASGQVGHLGTDKRGTDVRESMPFTVDYREHVDYSILGLPAETYSDVTAVDLGITTGEHGSHVAGIAAANDMFGGRMDGQAPGAKLVSARACSFGAGCTAAALTDGMAELATNRGVDIINMSIGGLPALNDGDNARADLYNRIINQLGVQIVISAGNSSAALNTVGDPSVATDVVSVGADITRETWKANYGSEVDFDENIMPFSSGGPSEDGGFKPNITAPGAAISTTPLWLPGSPVAEAGYDLRSGYSMLQGTSMASPQAAGSMTLLLSAARQAGVTNTTPAALRTAVYTSAAYNDAIPAFLQGHGQIDVPSAWKLLRTSLDTSTVIETSAPVCTEIWGLLGRNIGTGLYNRCSADAGGQAPDSRKVYTVTLTRTAGAEGNRRYALRLKGDDGTFRLTQSSVRLPLNTPVSIRVVATPAAGAHSAVLELDDARLAGVEGSMMMVVAAGQQFPESNTITTSGVSKRNEVQRYYVTVPEGVKALELGMSGLAEGSQTRFLAFSPYGVPVDPTSTINCYPSYGEGGNGCNPAARSYTNPMPGVWEILVESRRTSPLLENPFNLTAKLLGATVDPATTTLESVAKGVATPVQWTVTNNYADVTATANGGPLGSSRSLQGTATATGADVEYTVEVPEGASRLDVAIGNTSDAQADLDLFVSGPSGDLSSADGDSEESVSYTDPEPGTYTVRIDNYDVPAGTTTFDYRDVFFADALGSLAVDGTPFDLPQGSSKVVTGTVTANAAAAEGRQLFGSMSVVSESGAVLGTGEVLIKAVTG